MKKVWTGRYWMTEEHSKKISSKLKKYYKSHKVWNKGLKYGKYNESSNIRFRRDKNYYLKELELNAKRNIGLNMSPERRKEIEKWHKEIQERTGAGRPPKDWSKKEIQFLSKFWGKLPAVDIAIKLERSFSSVDHKASRLKLRFYNKWN